MSGFFVYDVQPLGFAIDLLEEQREAEANRNNIFELRKLIRIVWLLEFRQNMGI